MASDKSPVINPTAYWEGDPHAQLVADLDTGSLCNVHLGCDIADLSVLGPSARDYAYPNKGIIFDADESGLSWFGIAVTRLAVDLFPPAVGHVTPFAGTVRAGRRDWYAREFASERICREIWGDPYWRDVDDQELLLFFEFSGWELQIELALDGTPKALIAQAPPLMADEEQRATYGVTKPWPPPDPS